jgi:predicted GIY-YIG superfamily endonuclease
MNSLKVIETPIIITLKNGIELTVNYFNKVTGRKAIYIIVNSKNNKVYVGSSIDVCKRRSRHFKALEKNIHENKHLQNSYNKYGKEYFTMYLLEYIEDENDLLVREQYWLDVTNSYDKNIGYNNSPTAGNSLGVRHSEKSKEVRSKKFSGEGNPFYGKKHSKDTKKIIGEKGRKVVYQYDLNGNFVKEWSSVKETEDVGGFSRDLVSLCINHRYRYHKGYIWISKEEASENSFDIQKFVSKIKKKK